MKIIATGDDEIFKKPIDRPRRQQSGVVLPGPLPDYLHFNKKLKTENGAIVSAQTCFQSSAPYYLSATFYTRSRVKEKSQSLLSGGGSALNTSWNVERVGGIRACGTESHLCFTNIYSSRIPVNLLTPQKFFSSVPRPFVPQKAKLGGNATLTSLLPRDLSKPEEYNSTNFVIQSVSEQATLLTELKPQKLSAVLSSKVPHEYWEHFGRTVYHNCVGKQGPTFFHIRGYTITEKGLMELNMQSAFFNDPTSLKPHLKCSIFKSVRYLDDNEKPFPRIEVMEI